MLTRGIHPLPWRYDEHECEIQTADGSRVALIGYESNRKPYKWIISANDIKTAKLIVEKMNGLAEYGVNATK